MYPRVVMFHFDVLGSYCAVLLVSDGATSRLLLRLLMSGDTGTQAEGDGVKV